MISVELLQKFLDTVKKDELDFIICLKQKLMSGDGQEDLITWEINCNFNYEIKDQALFIKEFSKFNDEGQNYYYLFDIKQIAYLTTYF
ncbi:MAG: hypothetical protein ACFFCI_00675 [Promethearchaeota archaeon]